MKTIRIKGIENIRAVHAIFRKNKIKHWPTRFIQTPDVWEVTVRENDPIVSFILLKYG